MEIEIPVWLYETLQNEAAETGSTIEEIVEFAFRKFMKRNENNGINRSMPFRIGGSTKEGNY